MAETHALSREKAIYHIEHHNPIAPVRKALIVRLHMGRDLNPAVNRSFLILSQLMLTFMVSALRGGLHVFVALGCVATP